MSERYTIRDCRIQFDRAISAAQALGIDTANWSLHGGSATNGVAYKLIGPGIGSFSHIGRTAREAHAVLSALAFAWELAAAHRRCDDMRPHGSHDGCSGVPMASAPVEQCPPCDCGRQPGGMHTQRCAMLHWEQARMVG